MAVRSPVDQGPAKGKVVVATATVLDVGVIVSPGGFANITVIVSPFATVISEIESVRVVPVPDKAPFVAPVTMMSPTAKLVGSISKVSVNSVVVTDPEVPFAVKPEKATGMAGATATATVFDAGVIVNPAGFASATVIVAPFATVILEIARVRVLPVPVRAPLVAPVTVMSPADKLVGSTSKPSVNAVVVTDPEVPFAVNAEKVTAVVGTAAATATATVLDAGVIVNPAGFASATVIFAPFTAVMLEIARVRVVPVPVKAPLVAPVTVMSPADKLAGSTSKTSVNAVVVTDPEVPFAVTAEKATAVVVGAAATATATVLDVGVIVNPAGLAKATVKFAPFATVIVEIARVRVVSVPVKAPLVAPVTVMSPADKLVGSTSKTSVNAVVVSDPEAPFAVNAEKVTTVGAAGGGVFGVGQLVRTSPSIAMRMPEKFLFIFSSRKFFPFSYTVSLHAPRPSDMRLTCESD
jgi:hypothetical protein